MPRSNAKLRCFMLLTAIGALLTQSVGCAVSGGPASPAMFSATCSPASTTRSIPLGLIHDDASVDARAFAFSPLFVSTAAADHEMTHHALALAFIDSQPRERFDFMPMFMSTAAPGARPARSWNRAAPLDVMVDAD